MTSTEAASLVAVVTGGATGIGRAVCERLADEGVGTIIINYSRSAEAAERLAGSLSTAEVKAHAVQADISDLASVEAMFERIGGEFGRVDYLVNNAGTTELIPFRDLDAVTPAVWERLLGTNLLGSFWCSRAAAPLLKETRGAIVNVASIAGMRGVGSSLPYGVTKAGVLQLTRSLAIALAPDVRVNSVSAGTVRSGWHEKLVGEDVFAERSEHESTVVPLKRLAVPEDIAEGVVSLLRMSFVTGQDLLIDGGQGLLY